MNACRMVRECFRGQWASHDGAVWVPAHDQDDEPIWWLETVRPPKKGWDELLQEPYTIPAELVRYLVLMSVKTECPR